MTGGARLALTTRCSLTLVPTYHWSARGAFDRRMALWCSFILETEQTKVFHVGDTGYHDGSLYDRLGAEYGPFALAVLPIGAYEPRWFMSGQPHEPGGSGARHGCRCAPSAPSATIGARSSSPTRASNARPRR